MFHVLFSNESPLPGGPQPGSDNDVPSCPYRHRRGTGSTLNPAGLTRPLWAMCLEVLLSNDHSGIKDLKPLSFPAGRLWRDGSGLPVVLVLGLGDCDEPRER